MPSADAAVALVAATLAWSFAARTSNHGFLAACLAHELAGSGRFPGLLQRVSLVPSTGGSVAEVKQLDRQADAAEAGLSDVPSSVKLDGEQQLAQAGDTEAVDDAGDHDGNERHAGPPLFFVSLLGMAISIGPEGAPAPRAPRPAALPEAASSRRARAVSVPLGACLAWLLWSLEYRRLAAVGLKVFNYNTFMLVNVLSFLPAALQLSGGWRLSVKRNANHSLSWTYSFHVAHLALLAAIGIAVPVNFALDPAPSRILLAVVTFVVTFSFSQAHTSMWFNGTETGCRKPESLFTALRRLALGQLVLGLATLAFWFGVARVIEALPPGVPDPLLAALDQRGRDAAAVERSGFALQQWAFTGFAAAQVGLLLALLYRIDQTLAPVGVVDGARAWAPLSSAVFHAAAPAAAPDDKRVDAPSFWPSVRELVAIQTVRPYVYVNFWPALLADYSSLATVVVAAVAFLVHGIASELVPLVVPNLVAGFALQGKDAMLDHVGLVAGLSVGTWVAVAVVSLIAACRGQLGLLWRYREYWGARPGEGAAAAQVQSA